MVERMLRSAQQLEGLVLDGGWRVVERLPPRNDDDNTLAGFFSVGYIVESENGQRAFLKALDFEKAFNSNDITRSFEALASAYNFERDLLLKCNRRNMDRVVRLLDVGTADVPEGRIPKVPYLVFELAVRDVRQQLAALNDFDTVWVLRTLHHIATGLKQLHSEGIAHQDVKPSNILVFREAVSKIGDLGCASSRSQPVPRDELDIPGDERYAPPEQSYRHHPTEWHERRLSYDLYHLGSMAVFFFTGVGMSPLLYSRMRHEHWPENWKEGYAEILPYLRDAFGQSLQIFDDCVKEKLRDRGDNVRTRLVEKVRQLCDPDPALRGHPKNRFAQSNRYSLERYVTEFDLLALHAARGYFYG